MLEFDWMLWLRWSCRAVLQEDVVMSYVAIIIRDKINCGVGFTREKLKEIRRGWSTLHLVGQWSSSPDSALSSVNRRRIKGCTEWPIGAHKNSLKTNLTETQIESQNFQLKHVLEHKGLGLYIYLLSSTFF